MSTKAKAKTAAKKSVPAKKGTVKKPTKPTAGAPSQRKVVAAKKPTAKKPTKPTAGAPAKKVAEKKPAAKKPTAGAPSQRKEATSKKSAVAKTESVVSESTDLAVAFAEEMKRQRQKRDEEMQKIREDAEIKLSRRPTTRGKGKNMMQFSDADLAEFRKKLILLRQEAVGNSSSLRSKAFEQVYDRRGEDEDGSETFMRLQSLSQVDTQNKIIQKIDEALASIQEGTYGICEVCGQLIRKPRLMNLPFVHTCMECQSAMEQSRGGV